MPILSMADTIKNSGFNKFVIPSALLEGIMSFAQSEAVMLMHSSSMESIINIGHS